MIAWVFLERADYLPEELVGEAEERVVEFDRRQGAVVEDPDLGRQAVARRVAPEALDG